MRWPIFPRPPAQKRSVCLVSSHEVCFTYQSFTFGRKHVKRLDNVVGDGLDQVIIKSGHLQFPKWREVNTLYKYMTQSMADLLFDGSCDGCHIGTGRWGTGAAAIRRKGRIHGFMDSSQGSCQVTVFKGAKATQHDDVFRAVQSKVRGCYGMMFFLWAVLPLWVIQYWRASVKCHPREEAMQQTK